MDQKFNTETIREERFYYNRLFYDYIFDFPIFRDYFPYDHGHIAGYKKRIRDIEKDYDEGMREKIVRILEVTNRRLGAGERTMENIKSLSRKGSVVIIGGQQPGLFTGPSFIIYKILTVLKLSRYIQEKTGTTAIPCFWNASDDNNLEQADSLGLVAGKYEELKIDTTGVKKGTRLSNICLPVSRFMEIIENLELLLTTRGIGKEAVSFLRDAVSSIQGKDPASEGIGLARLFSLIVLRLFSSWGPVIVDPSEPDFKKLGSFILGWDLKEHRKINQNILESGRSLEETGYHAQLKPDPDVLDFFINKGDVREKIKIFPNGGFGLEGEKYTGEELLKKTAGDPSSVSWNVVLRPLIQDTILPVAATVCGPGEISYFAQLGGVYRNRGIKMPVICPRFSATVVEDKTFRLMKRSGIKAEDLCLKEEDAVKTVLRKNKSESTEDLIKELEKSINGSIEDIEDRIRDSGIDPESAFDRIKRNLGNEIKVLSKKMYSVLRKKEQLTVRGIEKIYLDLLPEGDQQERKINIFYYAGRYGIKIIDMLYSSYVPLEKGHKFIYIKEEKKNEKG